MSPALAWISAVLMAVGLALPIGYYEEDFAYWSQFPLAAIFVAFGLATFLWLIPWARMVKQLPVVSDDGVRKTPPMGPLLRHWSLWAMGIGHGTSNFAFYFLLAFTPLYLVQQRGLSIEMMTLLATLGYAAQGAAVEGAA